MANERAAATSSMLDMRSLREQVYEYLRGQMQKGLIRPGSLIKLNEISQRLGISKTPLRDAIIQLECEGFVTILARRGVVVNRLTLDEIKNVLEIVGALESAVLGSVFHRILPAHLKEMERLNGRMRASIQSSAFDDTFDQGYYELNIAFHDVFLELSKNTFLRKTIMPIKQRLYDFPRLSYIADWESINCDEHERLIGFIKEGDRESAVRLWKDSHWSFEAHEKFIREFYSQGKKQLDRWKER